IHVKGTIHWVSIQQAVKIEARLYDRLFKVEDPGQAEGDFKDYLNPDSLTVMREVYAEPAIASAKGDERYQFLRKGYFCLDSDSSGDKLIFNRTVTLRDLWAKK